ncbi:MAG TPA: hypothetical protein VGA09_10240 [Candidatus Binatia bacterium]
MSVDPQNSAIIYVGTEHSRLFYTKNGGARWLRADPNAHMCVTPDGHCVIAGTSDGTLLAIDHLGARAIVNGLPCITSVELAV